MYDTSRSCIVHLTYTIRMRVVDAGGTMSNDHVWDAPGLGPWQRDSAHDPVSQSRLMQQVCPAGFNRSFEETFAAYRLLLDRLAMGTVDRTHRITHGTRLRVNGTTGQVTNLG